MLKKLKRCWPNINNILILNYILGNKDTQTHTHAVAIASY